MPKLNPKEDDLLKRLTSKNVLTLGKTAMNDAATLIYRLMSVADEALKEKETEKVLLSEARFHRACLVVAAFGIVSKEDLEGKKSLTGEMREECLQLRQMHDDAKAYKALSFTSEATEAYGQQQV